MERFDDCIDDSWMTDRRGDVVFSLVDGFVWASWPNASEAVKLGSYYEVSAMMRDFLDQSALGERLTSAIPLSE